MKKSILPSFSVVIPSYNLGNTLMRTVKSVLNQSIQGVELIIVDDASTDKKTLKLLEDLKKNKDIKVVFLEKNCGVAHTRNEGIKLATAPYVLCLDSDDYIDLTYLKKAKKLFDDNDNIGIISPWYKTFGDNESIWKYTDNFTVADLLAENKLPSGSCVRKCIYADVGYYDEDRDLSGLDDWDLWIRIFTETKWKQIVITEPLFNYFIRMDSQQHAMSDKKTMTALQMIEKKYSDIIKKNSDTIYVVMQSFMHKYRNDNKKLLFKTQNYSQQIQEKNTQIQKRNEWIKEKNSQIQEKNTQIQKRNEWIKEKNSQIQEKNTQIQEKDTKIGSIIESKTYKLGDLFSRSVRKPYKLITYPFNFIKILLEK